MTAKRAAKKKPAKEPAMMCTACRCTDLEPCNPPCYWAFPDLCSSCYTGAIFLRAWFERAHSPNVRKLLEEATKIQGAGPLMFEEMILDQIGDSGLEAFLSRVTRGGKQ